MSQVGEELLAERQRSAAHMPQAVGRACKVRIAYLVTHPIQYQAPLLRRIARDPDIDLVVIFCSDLTTRKFTDRGFDREITWDVPLLGGYRHHFLPVLAKPDVVDMWWPLNRGLFSVLRKERADILWVHGYSRPYHWYALFLARLLRMKVLVRDEATDFSASRGFVRRLLKRAFFAVLARTCSGFLAIGKANREYYLKNGVPESRIFLMPYTVDNGFFAERARRASEDRERLREKLGLERGRPVVLFASKLSARKRPDFLLEAFVQFLEERRSVPSPYLLFVGDGELRPHMEDRVAAGKLKDVKLLGFANQTELPAYFDLCDVFVLPSVREPWGLVVNEAMNAGKPVIVSDQVGCAPDLVRHLSNGYVFRHDSVSDLKRALSTVLGHTDFARTMGARSTDLIRTWDFEADLAGLKSAVKAVTSTSEGVR